ncbi:TIGR03857 family LLM class F420-dependent oxidoreductase [Rhodococcus chondri]|uniref:TIGR03857 family LLM class F420-dependent oxidoreductase n=1 Tax=Rhodococcus chondri TaxID=3065941 RepID=A0ABU7JQ29_9NOCA|nr:TIGR03857 family LLM class F420-dependent oxidoreductase [Rhodococcus sp. CC-R104]MEE2032134.1 TIGR03857 family LLM class F420-dependent oxidoreductase [Rhodococcus sp. CC-R104]
MSGPGPERGFPELGFYGLAGHAPNPRDLLDEVRLAERLGLGAVFLSERFDAKDAAALAGAAAAVSESIGIGTAATNPNTRHPRVTATMATTLHRLSDGRYALGLGRGFDVLFDLMGLPRVTSARLEDAVEIYRTLWRGDAVTAHDGPAGSFPYLSRTAEGTDRIPILMVALGDRTLELAGRIADGVVLHPFFSDATLTRAVKTVRDAAVAAGRDPASVRIWAVLATVENSVPEEMRTRKLVGRLATYLQGYGDVLVRANGWDSSVLDRFRADPVVHDHRGAFDAAGTAEVLEHIRSLLPAAWLEASATGSAERCATRIADQFEAGADSVILHGATPAELAPVLPAWQTIRDRGRFAHLPANPGWNTPA